MMPRPCSICANRKSRQAIDNAIRAGGPIRMIAVQHKVSRQSITRHATHMKPDTGPPQFIAADAPSVPIVKNTSSQIIYFPPHMQGSQDDPMRDALYPPRAPDILDVHQDSPTELVVQAMQLIHRAFRQSAPEEYEALIATLQDRLNEVNQYVHAEEWP